MKIMYPVLEKMFNSKDVLNLAKQYDVDQSDLLETFICELLDIKPDELYAKIQTKKKYLVHYSGYYSYDVEVEASDEDEAREIADQMHDETDPTNFWFELDSVHIEEQ